MEDFNYKKIKSIVDAFTGKGPPPEPKIKPIFAYAPAYAVSLVLKEPNVFSEEVNPLQQYSYVVTLMEKRNKLYASIQAYMLDASGEVPIYQGEEHFSKDQGLELKRYMRQPLSAFTRCKNLLVMTFKNSDMTEKDFENIIELWRKN